MGGIDKGLAPRGGEPLALHALRRLAPQVGAVAVNANRHFETYAAFGAPVWPDRWPERPGPLAGILAGLERCATPYLATVPCDAPRFPTDLVRRLAAALAGAGADVAVAVAVDEGVRRRQPVFCLLKTGLAADLAAFLGTGQRRVGAWIDRQNLAEAEFDAVEAFANLNTPEELQRANADA